MREVQEKLPLPPLAPNAALGRMTSRVGACEMWNLVPFSESHCWLRGPWFNLDGRANQVLHEYPFLKVLIGQNSPYGRLCPK